MALRLELKWFGLKEKINKPLMKFQLMRSTSSLMNSPARLHYFSDLWWLTAGVSTGRSFCHVTPPLTIKTIAVLVASCIRCVHVKLCEKNIAMTDQSCRPGKHLNTFLWCYFSGIKGRKPVDKRANRAMLNQMAIFVLYFMVFKSVVCLIQAAGALHEMFVVEISQRNRHWRCDDMSTTSDYRTQPQFSTTEIIFFKPTT